MYVKDPKLDPPNYKESENGDFGKFYTHESFLFKEKCLCIPQGSVRESIIREAHREGLMGHFGRDNTLAVVKDHFFWLYLKKDVEKFCSKCITCLKTKSKSHSYILYTPLPIHKSPWEDISMDFYFRFAKDPAQGLNILGG